MVGSDGLPILPSEASASLETQQSQMMQHILLLAKEATSTRKSQVTNRLRKVAAHHTNIQQTLVSRTPQKP
jgi:hypothetical protein